MKSSSECINFHLVWGLRVRPWCVGLLGGQAVQGQWTGKSVGPHDLSRWQSKASYDYGSFALCSGFEWQEAWRAQSGNPSHNGYIVGRLSEPMTHLDWKRGWHQHYGFDGLLLFTSIASSFLSPLDSWCFPTNNFYTSHMIEISFPVPSTGFTQHDTLHIKSYSSK